MNISDFYITVSFSLLVGLCIGLVLQNMVNFLFRLIINITKKPKVLKPASFKEFFSIELRK